MLTFVIYLLSRELMEMGTRSN